MAVAAGAGADADGAVEGDRNGFACSAASGSFHCAAGHDTDRVASVGVGGADVGDRPGLCACSRLRSGGDVGDPRETTRLDERERTGFSQQATAARDTENAEVIELGADDWKKLFRPTGS